MTDSRAKRRPFDVELPVTLQAQLPRLVLSVCSLIVASVSGAAEPVSMPVAFAAVEALPAPSPVAEFAYGSEPSQFGRLWLPPEYSSSGAPVVVLLHGGCWLVQYSIDHVQPLAGALAKAGYAVWAIEYRRVGETGGGWPGTFADVAAGVDYLRQLPPAPLDLSRVVVVGHSAGGHLALWAAAREGFAEDHPLHSDTPQPLSGAIGLAAITDLASYAQGDNSCQRVTPRLMGGPPQILAARYRQASPAMLPQPLPVVLLQGSADPIVPMSQAQAMPEARLRVIEEAGHFDLVHPGTAAFTALREELERMLAP